MKVVSLFLFLALQLEECAIQLWNWAVTKNVGTAINNNQKAKGSCSDPVVFVIDLLMTLDDHNT